jgi:hypothetical protein
MHELTRTLRARYDTDPQKAAAVREWHLFEGDGLSLMAGKPKRAHEIANSMSRKTDWLQRPSNTDKPPGVAVRIVNDRHQRTRSA